MPQNARLHRVIACFVASLVMGTVIMPAHAQTAEIVPQTAHAGPINSIRFGRGALQSYCVTAGNDGFVRVWDRLSRRLHRAIRVSANPVLCLDIAPASAGHPPVLATASLDGDMAVWNLKSGALLKRYSHAHPNGVTAVAFSPDGRYLASAGRDGRTLCWTCDPLPRNAVTVASETGDLAYVQRLAWRSTGQLRLAAGRNRASVSLWDVSATPHGAKLAPAGRFTGSADEEITGVAWSPDGANLAIATSFERVWLWPSKRAIEVGKPVQAVLWRTDKTILIGDTEGRLLTDSIDSGTPPKPIGKIPGWVEDMALSANGDLLAAVGSTPEISLLETATWQPLFFDSGVIGGGITVLGFAPVNSAELPALIVGNELAGLRRWSFSLRGEALSLANRALEQSEGEQSPKVVTAMASVGQFAVTGLTNGHVVLWKGSPGAGAPLREIAAHTQRVQSVACSVHNNLIASVGGNLGDAPHIYTFEGNRAAVAPFGLEPEPPPFHPRSLAFNSGGTLLACGTAEGVIGLWETTRWRLVARWQAHTGAVNAVEFHPAENLLASCGNDGASTVWRCGESGLRGMAYSIQKSGFSILRLAWSPDGDTLLTGDMRGGLRFLHPQGTHPPAVAASAHADAVTAIAFGRNGRMVATGSGDGTICLWDTARAALVATLVVNGNGEWVAATPAGYYAASREGSRLVTFRIGEESAPFEQFDLTRNRPDAVVKAMAETEPPGSADRGIADLLIAAYYGAYRERCRRYGVALSPDGSAPRALSEGPQLERIEESIGVGGRN